MPPQKRTQPCEAQPWCHTLRRMHFWAAESLHRPAVTSYQPQMGSLGNLTSRSKPDLGHSHTARRVTVFPQLCKIGLPLHLHQSTLTSSGLSGWLQPVCLAEMYRCTYSPGQTSLAGGGVPVAPQPWELLGHCHGETNSHLFAKARRRSPALPKLSGLSSRATLWYFPWFCRGSMARGAAKGTLQGDPCLTRIGCRSCLKHAGPLQPLSPKARGSNLARGLGSTPQNISRKQ